jgi:cell division protein FtsB
LFLQENAIISAKNSMVAKKIPQKSCIYQKLLLTLQRFFEFCMERWSVIWNWLRKYVLNKYVLTLLIFAIVLTFCGEQSLLNRVRRAHEVREKEEELSAYKQAIEETNAQIDRMNASTENLEQFAREQYFMHADNEDVYIVSEE